MAGDEGGRRADGRGADTLETGLHPVVFVGACTMAGFLGLVTWFVIVNNELSPATVAWIALGGAVLCVAAVLPTFMRWRNARFLASESGFYGEVGWLRRHALDLPWAEIEDVDIHQTTLGRWLDFGTIRFLTRAGTVDGFVHVAQAPRLVALTRERLRARARSARAAR